MKQTALTLILLAYGLLLDGATQKSPTPQQPSAHCTQATAPRKTIQQLKAYLRSKIALLESIPSLQQSTACLTEHLHAIQLLSENIRNATTQLTKNRQQDPMLKDQIIFLRQQAKYQEILQITAFEFSNPERKKQCCLRNQADKQLLDTVTANAQKCTDYHINLQACEPQHKKLCLTLVQILTTHEQQSQTLLQTLATFQNLQTQAIAESACAIKPQEQKLLQLSITLQTEQMPEQRLAMLQIFQATLNDYEQSLTTLHNQFCALQEIIPSLKDIETEDTVHDDAQETTQKRRTQPRACEDLLYRGLPYHPTQVQPAAATTEAKIT